MHLLVLLCKFKCLWYVFTFILVLESHCFWIDIIIGFILYCKISLSIYLGAGTTFATSIRNSTTLLIIERFWQIYVFPVLTVKCFWYILLCEMVGRYQHRRETIYLHPQVIDGGRRFLGNIGAYAPYRIASLPKRSWFWCSLCQTDRINIMGFPLFYGVVFF